VYSGSPGSCLDCTASYPMATMGWLDGSLWESDLLAPVSTSSTLQSQGGSIYFIEVDVNAVFEPSYYLRSSGTNRISKATKYSHAHV
jgi:hypothetical protein